MRKLNRSEFKELLTEWRSKFINEKYMFEASRVIMDKNPDMQRELTQLETIDKTMSTLGMEKDQYIDFVLEEIAKHSSENTFIRFEKQYEENKIPEFKISPIVSHETPHGIYGYPLNNENAISLAASGKPTTSAFATGFSHFHLFKTSENRQIIVPASKEDKTYTEIYSKYNSKEKTIEDMKECFRALTLSIDQNRLQIKELSAEDLKASFVESLSEFKKSITNIRFNEKMFLINLIKDHGVELVLEFKDELSNMYYQFFKNTLRTLKKSPDSKEAAINNFIILKNSISVIATAIGKIKEESISRYYSLILHLVGIDSIRDKGRGVIHQNEPNQLHANDFSGINITSIGTYDNIFSFGEYAWTTEKDYEEIYQRFLEILNKKSSEINFDMSVSDHYKNRHEFYKKKYGNFSLDDFKIEMEKANSDSNLNFNWSGDTNAGPNPWGLVIKYSYDTKAIFNYAYKKGEQYLGEMFIGMLEALEIDYDEFYELEKSEKDKVFYKKLNSIVSESVIKKYIKLILS